MAELHRCDGKARPTGREGAVYHPPVRLILASASPRRADLLTAAGYTFDVVPVDVDEAPLAGETPARLRPPRGA